MSTRPRNPRYFPRMKVRGSGRRRLADVQRMVGKQGYRRLFESDQNEWWVAIQAERDNQRAKGYDAAHDDEHGADHLLMWAQDYAGRGERVKSAALVDAARELLMRSRLSESEIRREELADYIREEIWAGDFAEQDLEEADNFLAKYRVYRKEADRD